MPSYQVESEIVHRIPDEIATLIGLIMVSFAKLEYKLTMLCGFLLQLNRAESRIVLREPRAEDRLEMALDLFAIKAVEVKLDTDSLKAKVTNATRMRDALAHGLWLKHPDTGEFYLRLTKGSWPKNVTRGNTVKRIIFPQSIPYSAKECRETLETIEQALLEVESLGFELDDALDQWPERFRPPAPVLNPLASRAKKKAQR